MGSGIVKNLRKAGVPVAFLVHRDRSRVEELTAAGAVEAPGYAELAAESDVIMLTVPDSSVVEPLMLGEEGIGPHLRDGQIVVDLSTSYPASTQRIAGVLAGRGVAFLDAPVTGSRPEAESGTLHVMCGGEREAYDKVKPLFDVIAADVFHVGPSGCGHTIKLINNFLGQLGVAAISETLALARKLGVDPQALRDVVTVSGGNSKAFQGMMRRILEDDFSVAFQQKFVHKDVRYLNYLARENGTPSPLSSTLLAVHDMAAAQGYGEGDYSTLVRFWEKMSV